MDLLRPGLRHGPRRGRYATALAALFFLSTATGCSTDSGGEPETETATVTATADTETSANGTETPERTPQAPGAPAGGYREVFAMDHFQIGGGAFAFASADGGVECRITPTGPDPTDPTAPLVGECASLRDGEPVGELVTFSESDVPFSALDGPPDSPVWGFPYTTLEPGTKTRMGLLTCLSPAADSVACFNTFSGDGFLLTDGVHEAVTWESDLPFLRHADGTREVLVPVVTLRFRNGGELQCATGGPFVPCAGASGLNWPVDEDGDPVTAVTFSREPGDVGIHEQGDWRLGYFADESQPLDPGTYLFEGMTVRHDGETATFTIRSGERFWVGVDGFGVGPVG